MVRLDPEGNEQDWIELRPAGARRLRRFRIPRFLQEACFINLPVLKTHVVSTMTLGMKNPMGLLPRPDRRAMHTLGIAQCIVDMNRGIKPDLTIVDGSVGQDGEGPLYGQKADLQVLVAGRDSLAVDLVCCQLVGIKPRAIPHLKLALEQLGQPSLNLVGEDVGVIKQFRLPEQKTLYRFIFWLMYPLDYPYSWIAERGKHFCTTLYSTGLVGTRPQIHEASCTRCGICVETCPLPNVIDLKTLQVNYKTCQRCLLCYEACPENAISVKGYSGVRGLS
jgi:Pyruvate/2-oxoacid:ferredoxin oxidoreductase delta subunit